MTIPNVGQLTKRGSEKKDIDILMIYPDPQSDSPTRYVPLSILHPGVFFSDAYHLRVEYHDCRFESEADLWDKVQRSSCVAVSTYTGKQCLDAVRILKKVKEFDPEIETAVGGRHAQCASLDIFKESFVDTVFPGTYGDDLSPYNSDTQKYFRMGEMQLSTSFGCCYNCSFCALKSNWIYISPSQVRSDLYAIHRDIGFKEISFTDPNIACGMIRNSRGSVIRRFDRTELIRTIGKTMNDLQVNWDGNIRAEYCTPEMCQALQESRCTSIEIGCESGDDDFLKREIHKGYGVKEIKDACQNFVRYAPGVSVMYSFMHDMPGETPEMLNRTMDLIDWIHETDSNGRISIYHFSPYPGTEMYKKAISGYKGYPKFKPPRTMEEWGNLSLMKSPLYWITGLKFRQDNSRKNFPGDDWNLIKPYIDLAEQKWRDRKVDSFPCDEVENLIMRQQEKRNSINSVKPDCATCDSASGECATSCLYREND